jgi:ribonuclease P protein subunit POP4
LHDPEVVPKKNSLFTFSFPAYSFNSLAPPMTDAEEASDDATQEALYDPPTKTIQAILDTVPRIEIDVLGGSIRYRAADRAGRRFKVANGGGGWTEDWIGDLGFGIPA